VSAVASAPDFVDPAVCRVTVDGQEITDFYPYLVETKVRISRDSAAECRLSFDSMRGEDGSWLIQDAGIFEPWTKVVIEAVFGESSEEVMRGYVREMSAEYPEEMGKAQVTVTIQDESILLDREHIRRQWSLADEPMTDGEIAQSIASEYGLNADVEDGLANTSLCQDGTAIRFLRSRAEANGFEFGVHAGNLIFKATQLDAEAQAPILVYQGPATNCRTFSFVHDGYLPDQVAVSRATDAGTGMNEEVFSPNLALLGKAAADSSSMGLSPFVWRVRQAAGHTLDEAKARAQAKANDNAWKIHAQGELDGTRYGHVLRTHAPVPVAGIGDEYSGSYYVDEVTHVFTVNGYTQRFRLLRNALGDDAAASSPDSLAVVR